MKYYKIIKPLICLILVLSSLAITAQQKYTLSGSVKDENTGELIIGAGLYIKEMGKGVVTNQYGFYSLTLDEGTYNIIISFMGYENYQYKLILNKNQKLNISLKEKVITTKETVITSEKKTDKNVQSTDMGTVSIPIEQIKSIPAFLGEVDIMKTIQLTPGVQNGGEGNTGLYVRGGGPDQNLILLDEATVYNASHLFGFFSVFNADAVKNMELTKAGMPANYGGRLASVLDISMKDGNQKKFDVDGGIGVISSRLTVQGPIIKNKSSFIISARRTYIDYLMQPFINESSPFKGTGYYFYDLNTKFNYNISDRDKIYLSGYFGRDIFSLKTSNGNFSNDVSWGNATGCLRWNHVFNHKLFLNTSLIYSNYNFDISAEQNTFAVKMTSGITDYNGKLDFSYYPNLKHNVKFGSEYKYHIFVPNNATAQLNGNKLDLGEAIKLYSHEGALYINDEYEVTNKLMLNGGLRYTYFQQIGPFDRYIMNSDGDITDTVSYKKNENVTMFNNIEPRFSLRYSIDKKSSFKMSYTQNYQYIHLVSMSGVSLPTDLWVPTSDVVKPQYGVQYSLGYFRNFYDNVWETSVEVYYKEMKNQIEYKENYSQSITIKNNPDNFFTFGKGQSYGIELFTKKAFGKTTGWVGYTLSWTNKQFPEINEGKEFYAKYDRRHDISVIVSHDFNETWNFAAVFVYASGNTMTIPISRYFVGNNLYTEYGARNGYRMPPYHRMDVSVTYNRPKRKHYQSSWNFSIYNVYNRYNPYFIRFDIQGSIASQNIITAAKQVSIFPILPSVTWNFKIF